jgi:hypothetical protein
MVEFVRFNSKLCGGVNAKDDISEIVEVWALCWVIGIIDFP